MSEVIQFSSWVKWADRNGLTDKDRSGIYAIARFEQEQVTEIANPLDKNVVYIGESSGDRLQSRWRSFGRAAFQSKGKHRGGKRYREVFGNDQSPLYVASISENDLIKAFIGLATCPIIDFSLNEVTTKMSDEFLSENSDLIIKYIERRLILLYARKHGQRPICNAD